MTAEHRQQPQKVALLQGNATFCRLQIEAIRPRSGHVDENGAPPAFDTRQVVISNHDHDVVKTVLAPQPFGISVIRVLNVPVVVSVTSRITPPILR